VNDVSKPKRRWPRIVLIQLSVLVILAALAEIGVRVYLRTQGRPYDSEGARAALLELRSRSRDFVPRAAGAGSEAGRENDAQQRILHPYLGWEVVGSVEQLAAEVTRLGAGAHDGDYEVLIVGGSVADVFGQFGAPRLEERLRGDPRLAGREIYTYKYARGGFKHPQIVFAVQYLLSLGFTPECVVAIDGFNDVALSNDNATVGSNPVLPSTMHWSSLAMNGAVDRVGIELAASAIADSRSVENLTELVVDSGLYHSALCGTIAFARTRSLQLRARATSMEYSKRLRERGGKLVTAGPPFTGKGRPAIEDGVRAWEQGSRSLRAICEARGIRYVHVLQPTLHDPGAKPMTAEERDKGRIGETWLEGVTVGYPLLRAAGERLATGGEDYLDASRVFESATQTLYYDNCHFGPEGNKILADFVADHMLH